MGKNLNKRLTKVASALRSPQATHLGERIRRGEMENFFRTRALRIISIYKCIFRVNKYLQVIMTLPQSRGSIFSSW